MDVDEQGRDPWDDEEQFMSEEGFAPRHWVQEMARGLRSAASDSASESGAAVSASDAEEMQEAARAKYANRHQQVLSQEEGVAQGLVEELDWDVLVSALHSKEAAAVMDFVHRYDLGIDRGNASVVDALAAGSIRHESTPRTHCSVPAGQT
mmetsp:Transcript_18188/g.44657  ORF Transcript_18188/g.44657 Transcript_18188/m.44657 type:complete len:151 (+) Transcript_18188:227-679(+)